jgi:RNA polymerase sigma-70 factor (ECF subfamily)
MAPSPSFQAARAQRSPHLPDGSSVDDATLVRRVLAGDPRAAGAVFDRYGKLVRGVFCRILGPSADVADLVQDTFLHLHRSLPRLREPSALRSFVIGTAIRVARGELRRRRLRRFLALTPTGAMPDFPADNGFDPEARRAVRRLYDVLDATNDRGRVAFVLRRIDGYELPAVAEALGCSLATTKRVLARVEARVAVALEREVTTVTLRAREDHEPAAPAPRPLPKAA